LTASGNRNSVVWLDYEITCKLHMKYSSYGKKYQAFRRSKILRPLIPDTFSENEIKFLKVT